MTNPSNKPDTTTRAPGAPDPNAALTVVQQTMEKLAAAASVKAVYGEPVQYGSTLVIPAAEVLSVAGMGVGAGGARSDGGQDQGTGSGGGGGGRVLSRPVAVIVMSEQGVRVEPVVDVTKLALALLTAAGFVASLLLRIRRRRFDASR
jgi:uncharacterized spore protein YtfJ